jgi:NADPH:quinone reductase-like Zn-dependent oxidoreductase
MTVAERASTWAEYALALSSEVALKPKSVGWAEAAAVPLSALTAWQGLFEVVGLGEPDFQNYKEKWQVGLEGDRKRVLITGSSGGVGVYLVQPTVLAGAQIMAATSSMSATHPSSASWAPTKQSSTQRSTIQISLPALTSSSTAKSSKDADPS